MVAVVLAGCLCGLAIGQTKHPASQDRPEHARVIPELLKSGDDAKVVEGIERIKLVLDTDATWGAGKLRSEWLKLLASSKRYGDVEDLALRGILADAARPVAIEGLQEMRVRNLLAQNKVDEALKQARSLFNIASMKTTQKAILLVDECVNRSKDGTDLAKQFRQEQMTGAASQPANSTVSVTSKVMTDIVVDPKPYQPRIDELSDTDDRTLQAKGDLLLMAGRGKEAQEVFEKLLQLSDNPNRAALQENVARALKAQDGTIGRANSYAKTATVADKQSP